MPVPENLDLTGYRGTGAQAHEELMPAGDGTLSSTTSSSATTTVASAAGTTGVVVVPSNYQESIDMIVSMGYSTDQAKAALQNTDYNIER